ncbi:SUN3 protein, partial [Atlantisia rogersi]|nr:SUN3 protein [Atlantisia rogersi]
MDFWLQPWITTGCCLAFPASQGHVVIRLPKPIRPTAFTIWHISEAAWSSRGCSSAPKEFAVSRVDRDMAEIPLGTFTYHTHNTVAQMFHVQVLQGLWAGCLARR